LRLAHIVVGGYVLLAATVAASAGAASAAAPPRVFVLNAKALAANRARVAAGDKLLAAAVEDLRKQADKALKAGPFSVMDKKDVPPSGDKCGLSRDPALIMEGGEALVPKRDTAENGTRVHT
jgi:hypothetical protein